MELAILDDSFNETAIIDTYESLIWTERYFKCGDFELYIPFKSNILECIKHNYYAFMKDSTQQMIVEGIEVKTDPETGSHITFSGRSLESMLDRRIIWDKTILSGNFQNGIKKLLDENVINPSNANRKIPNFIFKESTDPVITALKIDAQYTGDNLYTVIQNQCETNGVGFQIILNDNNEFEFSLYNGADRSFSQEANPYVIFSKNFNNIVNSNYIKSVQPMKNVTLVAGEEPTANDWSSRRKVTVGTATGMNRRELFTDARDLQSTDSNGNKISDADYISQLNQRGVEKLLENKYDETFDGEIEAKQEFIYGKDFFKGDIVQIENELGIDAKARVSEYIRSQDSDGLSQYPTFSII